MKGWLDEFWRWFGRLAAMGRVNADDKAATGERMEAFHAGWDAHRAVTRQAGGRG